MFFRLRGLGAFLLWLVATPALCATAAQTAFPWAVSDEPLDPAIHAGRLSNGLSYIIVHNATPSGTATVRMRVAVGSLMEFPGEQGIAHYLEHMAFNGSTHMPEDQLVPFLQRHGFRYGADANAFTEAQKTDYVLDLPRADPDSLDAALFMLRETAGDLLLKPEAVARERKVVLGEERLRSNAILDRTRRWNAQVFAGQPYADFAIPIGKAADIEAMTADKLRLFYRQWYRPETTTIIVVGDLDPATVEARIRADFSDWRGEGSAGAPVDYGVYRDKGLTTFSHTGNGIAEEMGVTWFRPADPRTGVLARDHDDVLSSLALVALDLRLQHMARQPDCPFLSASAVSYRVPHTAQAGGLSITPKPGRAKAAFDQAYDALRQFLDKGVTPDEIAVLRSYLTVGMKNYAAGYATRSNDGIADGMIYDLDTDGVPTPLDYNLNIMQRDIDGLDAAEIDRRAKIIFSGDGPVLSHSGDHPSDFDEAAMRSAYLAANERKPAAFADAPAKPWPYTDFGPPVAPASRRDIPEFGYRRYVFPNGVKLNVKPTRLAAGQVLVEADFAGGAFRFSPKTTAPVYLLDCGFLMDGGLGKLKAEDINRSLAGRQANVGCATAPDKVILSGAANAADLATELQIMMAIATDSALSRPVWDRFLSILPQRRRTIDSTPGGVLADRIHEVTAPGDHRVDTAVVDAAPLLDYKRIQDMWRQALTDTPIEITIVGDVDEAAAVAETARTFATLPRRPATANEAPDARRTDFPPSRKTYTFYHSGRSDQAIMEVIWPLPGFYADPRQARTQAILTTVLNERLRAVVREQEGQAYDAAAGDWMSPLNDHYGFVWAQAGIKAGHEAAYRRAVRRIAADLRARPISDDDMERAKKPLLESIDNDPKTNGYWLGLLPGLADDPRYFDAALHRRDELAAVTRADVQAQAQRYLTDAAAITIRVLPKAAAAP